MEPEVVELFKSFIKVTTSYFREKVATIEELGTEIYEILSKDEEILVRAAVAKNPSTPDYVLVDLFNNDPNTNILQLCVLENINCPIEFLELMSKHESKLARIRVAKNPSTPEYILDVLRNDSEYEVRYHIETPHWRR